MPRLTLRTLLAYIDDTLEPDQARALGRKVADSAEAKQLIERIKKVTRRRGLHIPTPDGSEDDVSDPNTVAEYLSDTLGSDQTKDLESDRVIVRRTPRRSRGVPSDPHVSSHRTGPRPPSAHQRMYKLVEPPASDQNRKPGSRACGASLLHSTPTRS